MKILVTGAAGFLGSHLVKKLLDDDHHVIGLDNLTTSDGSNLEVLKNYSNFDFIRHDIIFPVKMEFDLAVNLACPASPLHYQVDPIQTLRTNFVGTYNVLELARACGASFFQASTSEVYGDPSVSPQSETYWGNVNPNGTRACYDEGKRVAEALIMDYKRKYNLNVKIARFFNTYGPNMALNDGRVVSNFIIQALQNRSLTIYGDGSQTRSFCYVDDLIDGIFRFLNFSGEVGPINLGNPAEISMIELAKCVIKITNSTSSLEFSDFPPDDPKLRKPDIEKASRLLGWSPTISLEEGVSRTAVYFKGKLGI
jgi:UDP-glucuronate decarboxylase